MLNDLLFELNSTESAIWLHNIINKLLYIQYIIHIMQAETKADHICENFSLIAGQYKKEDLLSGKDNGQGK